MWKQCRLKFESLILNRGSAMEVAVQALLIHNIESRMAKLCVGYWLEPEIIL